MCAIFNLFTNVSNITLTALIVTIFTIQYQNDCLLITSSIHACYWCQIAFQHREAILMTCGQEQIPLYQLLQTSANWHRLNNAGFILQGAYYDMLTHFVSIWTTQGPYSEGTYTWPSSILTAWRGVGMDCRIVSSFLKCLRFFILSTHSLLASHHISLDRCSQIWMLWHQSNINVVGRIKIILLICPLTDPVTSVSVSVSERLCL